MVDFFSSPDEDIARSSATAYIYDERFKFIGKFGDYRRVNVHEILSDNHITNLITKEVRNYTPDVMESERKDNTSDEFFIYDGPEYTLVDDSDLPI